MNPAQLVATLQALEPLGLTASHVARLHGYKSHRTAAQWREGRVAIPPHVAAWLLELKLWFETHQPEGRL